MYLIDGQSAIHQRREPARWADLFRLIEATPHLDGLLLTKCIGNVPRLLAAGGLPRLVCLGATVVKQAENERDLGNLPAVPARVRFLSVEPMLGPLDAGAELARLDWVIAGG